MKFTFYWLDGLREVLEESDYINALIKAGYGNSALRALDFWCNGDNKEFYYDKKWIRKHIASLRSICENMSYCTCGEKTDHPVHYSSEDLKGIKKYKIDFLGHIVPAEL